MLARCNNYIRGACELQTFWRMDEESQALLEEMEVVCQMISVATQVVQARKRLLQDNEVD